MGIPGGAYTLYTTTHTYDLAGNVKRLKYPSGKTVDYTYDDAGRAASVTGNLGDGVARTYSSNIAYSPFGGMTQEQFGTQTPLYNRRHYNVRGQLFDLRLGTGASDEWSANRGAIINFYSRVAGYQFGGSGTDNNGNLLLSENYVSNDDSGGNHTGFNQLYEYDNLNRLQWVKEHQSWQQTAQQTFQYDRFGNRTIDISPAATWGVANTKAFTADQNTNRLNPAAGQSGVMGYDNAGNLTTDTYTGSFTGERTYDAENRMVTARTNSNQITTYTYDGDGRRVRSNTQGIETRYLYGMGGELLAEYTPGASKEYAYRGGEMLVQANIPEVSTTGLQGEYFNGVNHESHVTTRTDASVAFDWGGGSPASGVNTDGFSARWTGTITPRYSERYTFYAWADDAVRLWVDGQLIIDRWGYSPNEESATTAQVLEAGRKYTIRMEMYEGGGGAGAFLSWSSVTPQGQAGQQAKETVPTSQLSPGAQPKWMVKDHLGTPRMIVDQTGSLSGIRRHDYLPFGEEVGANVGGRTTGQGYSQFDGVRQGFTGYEKDGETGLNFAQSRYQSPTMGRFISPDEPFADQSEDEPQSWNLYPYVRNNPLRFIDPTGRETCNAIDENGRCTSVVGDYDGERSKVLELHKGGSYWNAKGGYWESRADYRDRTYNPTREFGQQMAMRTGGLEPYGRAVVTAWSFLPLGAPGGILTGLLGNTGRAANVARAACFVAGTPVLTKGGLKSIEDIKAGDKVASYNEETKQTEYKTVVQTMVRDAEAGRILSVKVGGESEPLGVTNEHPFYVRVHRERDDTSGEDDDEGEWREAGELRAGDEIKLASGGWAKVQSIIRQNAAATVYNFEVADNHNYFVGQSGLLVHNNCLPSVTKAVNSNLIHAAGRALERGFYGTKEEAAEALRNLSSQITKSGFPEGTIQDTAHADRVLVPLKEGAYAVYQVAANGTAKLKTVLTAK